MIRKRIDPVFTSTSVLPFDFAISSLKCHCFVLATGTKLIKIGKYTNKIDKKNRK
jgi:hypothetical protein